MTKPTPPKPQIKPYLTIIPGRSPEQKSHTRLGDAKNAVVQYPKRPYRGRYDSGKYVFEEIDGIRTGRKKYVYLICGGQIWEWNTTTNEWDLLYDIPEHSYDHEIPWKADEYRFYVEDK